jgi:hypothetical protein
MLHGLGWQARPWRPRDVHHVSSVVTACLQIRPGCRNSLTWASAVEFVALRRSQVKAALVTAVAYLTCEGLEHVYVNSKRPYRSATASADGYSWSHETNGSGYALIYLNGPPPAQRLP